MTTKPEIVYRLRSPEEVDKFRAAMVPVDRAFFESEQKWGVGRLERLVSTSTLEAYRRGWDQYRAAIEAGDAGAVTEVGPKMIAALAFMDAEATEAGHAALAPETWEAGMTDGTVLVVVRTNAEASAVIRAANGSMFAGMPGNGAVVAGLSPNETTLPPDLAVTVRSQHEGRSLRVVTMAEIARLIEWEEKVATAELKPGQETKKVGTMWEGDATQSGIQQNEMAAYDLVRSGYPLTAPLAF